MKIGKDDIKFLQQWMTGINPKNLYWGFICSSRQDYVGNAKGVEDNVIYGIYDREGGCFMEIRMIWDSIGVRMHIYDDAFALAASPMNQRLWQKLLTLGHDFTSESFSKLLIQLGFQDDSDILLS